MVVAPLQRCAPSGEVQQQAAAAEVFWQNVVDSLPVHVAVLAADGTILAVNEPWARFAEESGTGGVGVGWNYLELCSRAAAAGDRSAGEVDRLLRELIAGERDTVVYSYRRDRPGQPRWFELRAARHANGPFASLVVQHHEVSETVLRARQLRLDSTLLETVPAAVAALNAAGEVIYWNPAAESLYGWSAAEVMGKPIAELIQTDDGEDFARTGEVLLRGEIWDGPLRLRRKDGSTFMAQVRGRVVRDHEGAVEWMIAISSDASARIEQEAELRSAQETMRAVAAAIPDGLAVVDAEGKLLFLNPVGERLLGWSAAELADSRAHDVLHVYSDGGGCEFATCPVTRARRENQIVVIEDDEFVRRDGSRLPVSYKASPFTTREGVSGAVVVFRDISREKAEREAQQRELQSLSWAARVQEALEDDGFCLYAQPIIEVGTGQTHQHELLLRMRHDGHVIAPAQFLPAAGKYGLMPAVDRWVISEALRFAASGAAVELNLSSESLARPELIDEIEATLQSGSIDPSRVVIEITETSIIENEDLASRFLTRLARLGLRFALDDFGTGYSGFNYLKQLPVHYLKIDREFVCDLADNPSSEAVVRAVVDIAHAFGQKTVAEGVEDAATLSKLADFGIDYAQGYYFGQPAPAEDILHQGTGTR